MAKGGKKREPGLVTPLRLLEDEPIRHHDEDDLSLEPFAGVVAGTATGTPGPFTIGVFADWGQGKTSLLRQSKSLIDRDADVGPRTITVWFNAWQFEREEHPIVPLLATIVSAIEARRGEIERDAEVAEQLTDKFKAGLRQTARAMRAMAYGFSAKAKFGVPGFGEVEAGFVAKEMIEREEELAAKESARDPLLMRSLYFNAFEMLGEIGGDGDGTQVSEKDRPKIVVFVDDLDRCSPEKAIHLLESIKLALAQPGFVFVLAVARRIIESHIRHRYEKEYGVADYAEGARYLDKIVQLPLPIPSHKERFEEYIKRVVTSRMEGLDADLVEVFQAITSLLRIGSRNSPRMLVRLINNLLVDARLFDSTRFAGREVTKRDFVGLAAVSRSLRAHLTDHEYETIAASAQSEAICKNILRHGREGLESGLGLDAERSGGDGDERRMYDPSGRANAAVRALERLDIVDDLRGDSYGKRWLESFDNRRLVDEFFAEQREQDAADEIPEDQRTIVDRAIRKSLGLPANAQIDDAACARVTELNLGGTEVSDAGLSHVSRLDNLKRLILSRTQVSDTGLSHVSELTSLTRLYLSDTQVSDAGLSHVSELTSLTRLYLSDTQVSDTGLSHVSELANLAWLGLSGTQVSDAGLSHVSELTSLTRLYLSGTQVSDAGLSHVSELTSLTRLYLSGTQVSDAGLSHVSKLTSLKELSLSGTQVSDAGLSLVSKLTSLEWLYLSDTQVSDTGLSEVSKLTSLRWLDLSRTQVSDDGVAALERDLPGCAVVR